MSYDSKLDAYALPLSYPIVVAWQIRHLVGNFYHSAYLFYSLPQEDYLHERWPKILQPAPLILKSVKFMM